jgi:hypothetical protein
MRCHDAKGYSAIAEWGRNYDKEFAKALGFTHEKTPCSAFQHLIDNVKEQMVVFSDTGFEKIDWHPTNLRICKLTFRRATEEQSGEWNVRMLIETVLSMLTYVCDFKHSRHKSWEYFETKLGFTIVFPTQRS